jgi:hypothetical protein
MKTKTPDETPVKTSFILPFLEHWKSFASVFVTGIIIGILFMLLILGAHPTKIILPGIGEFDFPAAPAEITATLVPTALPSSTPTLSPTQTSTLAPTPTLTSTLTPTPTRAIIFEDDFLVLNPFHWHLPDKDYWGATVDASIGAEKLKLIIDCPAADSYDYCSPTVQLQQPVVKDFDLTYDLLLEQLSPNASVRFNVRFRENPGAYYSFNMGNLGDYYFDLYSPKSTSLIEEPNSLPVPPEVGKPITFRIIADSASFNIYENGTPIASVKDGRLDLPGTLSFFYYVKQGTKATISIKNFHMYAVP